MRPNTLVNILILYWLNCGIETVLASNVTHTHSVACCDFWKDLSAFVTEKTGSKMSYEQCMEEYDCTKNKLLKQFLHQSNRLTNQNLFFDAENKVRIDTTAWSSDVVSSLLAWAFVGRIVSAEQSDDNLLSLIYDFQTDQLSLQRTTCEFDRSIYTSMVLISVSLLTYFIVHRVIKQTPEAKTSDATMQTEWRTHDTTTMQLKPSMQSSNFFLLQSPHGYTSLRQK